MTRILFDHSIFHYRYGGASKYFAMLLKYLPREIWTTTALLPCNEYVRAQHLFPTCRKMFRGQNVLMERLNRPYTRWKIKNGAFDVLHQTNFSTDILDLLNGKALVTTFHDTNLSTFDPHPEIVERQRLSLERAEAVVCVSENTKRDMLGLFDVDERKVHVVYHGIEPVRLDLLPEKRLVPFPYILYVGRRSAYKNFGRLVDAFARVRACGDDVHLVCTDSDFTREEYERFASLGIADVVHHFSASELEMQLLYRDAELFVFPSLYEGFGMPILEAWSVGCPVVLSRSSCFPEIAGDGGAYFAAEDVGDMSDAIQRVLEDKEYRSALIARGEKRVRMFSWENCAAAHLKVYENFGK